MAIEAHPENGPGGQLAASEERFQLLFDHSPDAVLLCDPHASEVFWPIVACNSVAAQMNGYARDELIGQSIQLLHPDANAAAMRAVFLQALHAAETVHGEAAHQRKDGTVFPIEFSATLVDLKGRDLVS